MSAATAHASWNQMSGQATPGSELSHARQPIAVITVEANGGLLGQTAVGPIPFGHDGAELAGALLPRGSRLLDVLDARFTLTALGEDQRALAHRFTGDWVEESGAIYPIDVDIPPTGIRALECALETKFDAGRRTLVVGRIRRARRQGGDANPLRLPAAVLDSAAIQSVAEPAVSTDTPAISLPADDGDIRMIAVNGGRRNAVVAVALVGRPEGTTGASIYFHRGCVVGDALDNADCSRRRHLEATLEAMRRQGSGVVVYYRDEPSLAACCLGGGGSRRHSHAASTVALLAARDVLRSLDLRHPTVIRRPEDVPEWRLLAPGAADVRDPAAGE